MKTIKITQYLRPDGEKRELEADVEDKYAEMSRNMILSAEVLPTEEVVLYARFNDEPEEKERLAFANNELPNPGKNLKDPTKVLCELIEKKFKERN